MSLAGCGGGGGGTAPTPNSGEPKKAPASEPTVVANLYARDQELPAAFFWALALQKPDAGSQTYEFYAVNYNGNPATEGTSVTSTLYSGTLTSEIDGKASFTGLAMRPDMTASNVPVASGATLQEMFSASSTLRAKFDEGTNATLDRLADAKTTVDQIAGKTWTGRWVDGGTDSAAKQKITVGEKSESGARGIFNAPNCTGIELQVLTLAGQSGLYRATLGFKADTTCKRSGTLTGLAAVQPLSGGSYRLHLVATSPNGNGVSFRGDWSPSP